MGLYIDPEGQSKEDWLKIHGERIDAGIYGETALEQAEGILDDCNCQDEEYMPVCLVDNGPFTAAGICYDGRELVAFLDPTDNRPKTWYLVPVSALTRVQPHLADMLF